MQGCATHQKFVTKYNAWVGQDINDLVQKIGYPDSTYVLPNKNKVYVYARSRIYSYPSMSMGYGGYGGHYGGYGMFGYGTDVCLVMALMLSRKHVNFTLRLIENLLSSNGVHGVMPVFQTSGYILKKTDRVAMYV